MIVTKRLGFALASVLVLMGFAAKPAEAQVVPVVRTCSIYDGFATNTTKQFSCGGVLLETRLDLHAWCDGGAPFACHLNTTFSMRAHRQDIPGWRVTSAHAFDVNTGGVNGTCDLYPKLEDWRAFWTKWCTLPSQPQFIEMIGITVPAT